MHHLTQLQADFAWKQKPKIPEHFRGRNPLVVYAIASEYMGRSMDMINTPEQQLISQQGATKAA